MRLLADLRTRSHEQLATALSGWNDAELISLNHRLTRLNHDLLVSTTVKIKGAQLRSLI